MEVKNKIEHEHINQRAKQDLFHCAHAGTVKEQLPKDEICTDIADFFKIFGDSSRIKLLFAMLEQEICVHDLSIIVGMSQSAVSHQLKTLRHYKVVKVRKEGKSSFYSLDDEHIHSVLTQGMEHVNHS